MCAVITPEELAAMRAADEEIDRTFRLTAEDRQLSKKLDRDAMQQRGKRTKARQRTPEQRERNRAYLKARYWGDHESALEYRRRYYAEHREEQIAQVAAYQKAKRRAAKEAGPTYFKTWLRQHGVTQKEAAEKLGVSLTCVRNWSEGLFRPKTDIIRAVWPEYGGET